LVTGSPGGSRIINYTARSVMAVLDWDMDPQSAVARPHVISRNGTVDLEQGTTAESLKAALEARGHQTRIRALTSGLHTILASGGGYRGGADPRREGTVDGR
ncbi:MAG: gamma-glutamyltransferase, partial [Rhodospirillales bacterium]